MQELGALQNNDVPFNALEYRVSEMTCSHSYNSLSTQIFRDPMPAKRGLDVAAPTGVKLCNTFNNPRPYQGCTGMVHKNARSTVRKWLSSLEDTVEAT
mmetsp:Transcript_18023/g.26045  ORF Transcript_18023/g.26045 Transcript_18023/m.26045 type:complete len:98 (-) Transcript_18023:1258-1551(-)